MASIHARLAQVKEDSEQLIDPKVVVEACHKAGHSWRERALDPVRTLHAFASQVMHGNTAMAFLCRRMGNLFCESAYCQARARLPVSVVQAAVDDFTARAIGATCESLWCGHRTVLVDGTGTLGRVSFIDALRWMLLDTDGVPTTLRRPPDLKLWPIRPPRFHPRLVKYGDQCFRVMHTPRKQLIEACLTAKSG